MNYQWLVVLKCDGENPPEVFAFEKEEDAYKLYAELKLNWSDVYLCKIIAGDSRENFF